MGSVGVSGHGPDNFIQAFALAAAEPAGDAWHMPSICPRRVAPAFMNGAFHY
jgi:hypothetical protein